MTDSSSNDILVSFQNVQKSYDGESLVVKNLNLDVRRGEFLTMLGPSGSGKTTVLMMLAGFESATHGEILLNGESINSVAPHKRGLGMVFQNYALFPHMSVKENLAFPLQVRKMNRDEIDHKVQKVLDMVQLSEMGGRRPSQLSGGQQQRVAVARSLVFDPVLVLMDEPLGALDKNLREEMQYEIKRIHDNTGISVVYVTHDQTEALTMSNRIAVFDDGIVQQLDEPNVLYEKPNNAFVASFIGENNKLFGKVSSINIKKNECKIEIDDSGKKISALPINVSEVGEKTTVSIRPERVEVNTDGKTVDNVFEAKILELIYHGDHIRGKLEVLGSSEFIIKVPNAGEMADLRVGNIINVGWVASNCRALDYQRSN